MPVAVHHEAHGDAGHRALDRHAGVHEGERAAAHGGHRGRPVRLEDVGDDADRVGEGLLGRQHLAQRPLGEDAVADLAPAGAAQELHLPDREGREVVVEHEALAVLGLLDRVDDLRVLGGAEGRGDQGLRLAAGEERRAVGAGQDAHLAGDRPDLVEAAAVEPVAVLEDLALEQLLAQPVVDGGERGLLLRLVLRDGRDVLVLHLLHLGVGLDLALDPRIAARSGSARAPSISATIVGIDLLLRERAASACPPARGGPSACATICLMTLWPSTRACAITASGTSLGAASTMTIASLGAGHQQVELALRLEVGGGGVDDEGPVPVPDPHRAHRRCRTGCPRSRARSRRR